MTLSPLRSILSALLVSVLLLSGCAAAPSPQPTPVAIPDSPVGETAQWVLGILNADGQSTPQHWEGRLSDEFVAAVSVDELVEIVNDQIRPARPFTPTAYQGTDRIAVVTVTAERGEPFDLSLVVDADDRISEMLFGPTAPAHEPAESLDEVLERLDDLPGETRALVLRDDEVVLDRDPDETAPIGSVFKLYVLDAVAEAVATGVTAWDAELLVSDDVRSLPSGELQDAAPGTVVSVREAAEKMIAISDNTATDLLITHVGRDAVEDAVSRLGHHDPALLRPFPTTREVFALLWGGDEELVSAWAAGDERERREVLERLAAQRFDVTVTDADDRPQWRSGFEWFASAADIAAAHAALAARAQEDPVVGQILTENPGLALDGEVWPDVAFKGGSSPGVLAGSWRAIGADGAVVTVVVLSADPDEPITPETQVELFGLAEDVFTLLG